MGGQQFLDRDQVAICNLVLESLQPVRVLGSFYAFLFISHDLLPALL